jgi:hypothetical protein
LRQRDAIAQLMFNVTLKTAIRRSTAENRRTIFDKCRQIMAYGDDVVITERILQDVKHVFTPLVEQTSKIGLETDDKEKNYEGMTKA